MKLLLLFTLSGLTAGAQDTAKNMWSGHYTSVTFADSVEPRVSFYDTGRNSHSVFDIEWFIDSGRVRIYGDTVAAIRAIAKLCMTESRKKDSLQRLLAKSDSSASYHSYWNYGEVIPDTAHLHPIETGCYFTFPNGHTITCDSLYLLFQRVSEYENRLDSLIKEMRGYQGPLFFDSAAWYMPFDIYSRPGRNKGGSIPMNIIPCDQCVIKQQ